MWQITIKMQAAHWDVLIFLNKKLPLGEVHKVYMKHKCILCLDLCVFLVYLIIYVYVPKLKKNPQSNIL